MINWKAFKITPAIQAIFVGLFVLILGAAATALTAAAQYATQNGNLNWTILFTLIGSTFVLSVQSGFAGYIKAHVADAKQAMTDFVGEVRAATMPTIAPTTAQTAAPHVVIYANPTTPAAVTPSSTPAQTAPAAQQPAPTPEPTAQDLPMLESLQQATAAQIPAIIVK